MPTISSGSASITLPAGQTLRFDAGGDGLASVALPGNNLHFEVGETPRVIGPFQFNVSVSVNAIRPLTYSFGQTSLMGAAVDTNGVIYNDQGQYMPVGGSRLSPYMGFVANRCYVPCRNTSSNGTPEKQAETASRHWFRDNVAQGQTFRMMFANFNVLTGSSSPVGTGQEAAPGGDMLITVALEYPIGGPRYQVIYQQTITNGQMGTFDFPMPFNAVKDTSFKVRCSIRMQGSGTLPYWYPSGATVVPFGQVLGEGFQIAVSGLTDLTLSGEPTAAASAQMYFPAAMIAMTSRPSIFVIGDSRSAGSRDDVTPDGLSGNIIRQVGNKYGVAASANGGEFVSQYVNNQAKRSVLYQYASDIVIGTGINDFGAGGLNFTQVQTATNTLIGQVAAGKQAQARIWLETLQPWTTSTDSWATVGNQTVMSWEAQRVSYNNWLRQNAITNVSGVIETADAVESGRNTGRWSANTGVSTLDGIHPNPWGYQQVARFGNALQVMGL